MKQKFNQDLQTIYDELQSRQASLNSYYDLLTDKGDEKAEQMVDGFLNLLKLPKNADTQMAALTRIVNLREDALEQVLQKQDLTAKEIAMKKELAYGFVSMMHISRHEKLIAWIENNKLLTPFYRHLIFGMHYVGIRLSEWQSVWTGHIINGVNVDLQEKFSGDDSKVFEMLHKENLLDVDGDNGVADRCYSVLVRDENGEYSSQSYAKAFPTQVQRVVAALEQLMALLQDQEDDVYGQKEQWLEYFVALKEAFAHTTSSELIQKWAMVDTKWMAIQTPLQIGHPLEYYEDHYRKAVALEWDLRIINPRLQSESGTRKNIKNFASRMADEFGADATRIMDKNLSQVDQTQLYIGQPMLYYAAEFNGLFSAQVVPNDEQVSAKLGKKIFAYADFVMQSKKAKPTMRLSVEMMGEQFVKKQKDLIDNHPQLWQEIYDISTVGHEYGHILWIDTDTETLMNATGQFKNIEEFKATAGGLMAFFYNENDQLQEHIIDDVVSRAVGLMAWREVGEVLPYYCEGLIHLEILFDSGIISYDGQIHIDYTKYDAMKQAYTKVYKELASAYLSKEDASTFLSSYTVQENGAYLPIKSQIREFVELYYSRYQEIGQQTL